MPQITCPNCGRTINLEKRREIDLDLIKHAALKGPTTFTEILRLTKLPRKTLSMRLKDLCENGTLVKQEGMYVLNGNASFDKNGGHLMKGVSRMLNDRRIRTGLMLVAFLLSSSVTGYVMATLMTARQPDTSPRYLGTFTMQLNVADVADFCAWQVLTTYDPAEIGIISVTSGGFVGVEPIDPDGGVFTKNADIEGRLLLGGSIIAGMTPKEGDGILAIVTFGYYVEGCALPEIDFGSETYWINSLGQNLDFELDTLTFG